MITASDCWSEMQPYPFDDVIANLEPYCDALTRREQRIPEWQRIQLELARAYREKAVALKEEDRTDGRIKRFERDASKMIKALARNNGPHKAEARRLMEQWNLKVEAEASEETKPITTFAEAKQRGLDLMAQIEDANAEIADLKTQLISADRAEATRLRSEVREAEESLWKLTTECIGVFERALNMADKSIAREDWNQIRYLQAVCYYVRRQYFESALIGEFLVNRFPTIPFSRQAGGIAIRSYAALHDAIEGEEKAFEKERLSDLAEKVIEIWPGSNESNEASSTLARLILAQPQLDSKDVASVTSLISKVAESSSSRAGLEVKLGTKMWFSYRRAKSSGDPAEADSLLANSIRFLETGVNSFKPETMRMDVAWGALFLSNAYLEKGDLDSAIQQLESRPIAPVDLIKQKNRVILDSGKQDLYLTEAYKVAGKAYLSAIGKYPEDSSWADKCLSVVKAFRTRAKKIGNAKSKAEVSNMYRLIAVQLEQQLSRQTEPKKQEKFIGNLRRFIDTLQSESDDANTIIWSGGMLMKLGDIFVSQGKSNEAKPLFSAAIAALDRADKMGVTDKAISKELKRQQAIAKRGVGKYEDSVNDFIAILKENPNDWQIQMDAAETLQIWGLTAKNSKSLAKALSGTEKYRDPKTKRQKNLIWGWSSLAQALKTSSKFKNSYYESLFNAVSTRMRYGVLENNAKVVSAALKRLQIAKNKEKNLGGDVWGDRFVELEQQIRNQLQQMNRP